MDEVIKFLEKQNWTFAKTYAEKSPHEYIVRHGEKTKGTDKEFMDAVDYIYKNGLTIFFWSHPNQYFFHGDYYYWVMTDNMSVVDGDKVVLDYNDWTIIINRAKIKDYKFSVKWKGVPK